MFLSADPATQIGLFALLPQVVDAVKMPVIAAGGISDARAVAAALTLGAAAVQIGTAFLFCPEAKILPPHLAALRTARDDSTVLTNVLSGRLARGLVNRAIRELGPISDIVPEFPLASGALAPLHAKVQAKGSGDFSPMFAGQAVALGRELPAGELTRILAAETLDLLLRKPRQAATSSAVTEWAVSGHFSRGNVVSTRLPRAISQPHERDSTRWRDSQTTDG